MELLEFDEVISLLNKTRVVRIDPTPKRNEPSQWSFWTGEFVVPGQRIQFEILYLYSRATREGALGAKKSAFSAGITQVVYASSLDGKAKFHRDIFAAEAKHFLSLREYLSSFLRDAMAEYVVKLAGLKTPFYIDPKIATPAGVIRQYPNPVELLIGETTTHGEPSEGIVGVLLAEPGQGKTFMCDHIVSRLASRDELSTVDVTPIYVASEQWKTMSSEDLSSLWKTLGHSFRHYEAPIGWLEGSEGIFIRVTLKAGLLRLVFDGLDEYVLRNKGEISAIEVLRLLCDLAEQTGTRMLVTARTTFWESEVRPQLVDARDDVQLKCLREYRIEPFDRNHARKYFHLRFPTNAKAVERATNLFALLGSDTQKSFAGRGFVLRLIADLYERDPDFSADVLGRSPVWWLMTRLCEREQLRQRLPLTADQQLDALTEFVRDVARGSVPNSQTLEAGILVANPTLTDTARVECVQKLTSHPIINRLREKDEWVITQEQAQVALMAKYVERITHGPINRNELQSFSEKIRLGPGARVDLATMLVDDLSDQQGGHQPAKQLVSDLINASQRGEALGPRLGLLIALKYVDAQRQSAGTKKERIELLRTLLPDGKFRNLVFSGSVSKFDFSGITFEKCRFDNVSWTDCQFDNNTNFDRCEFYGGTVEYCARFGEAQLNSQAGDTDGLALLRSLQVASGARAYAQADLKEDMLSVLSKFIPRAGYAFKSIRKEYLSSGVIRRSRYREEILEEIEKFILESHSISGLASGGYNIRQDCTEAMRFLAQNNVFTGRVQECFESLCARLKLQYGAKS